MAKWPNLAIWPYLVLANLATNIALMGIYRKVIENPDNMWKNWQNWLYVAKVLAKIEILSFSNFPLFLAQQHSSQKSNLEWEIWHFKYTFFSPTFKVGEKKVCLEFTKFYPKVDFFQAL